MRFFAYHTSFSYEIMLAKDKCHAKSVVLRNVAFEGESANIGSMPYRGKDIMDFILRFLAMVKLNQASLYPFGLTKTLK